MSAVDQNYLRHFSALFIFVHHNGNGRTAEIKSVLEPRGQKFSNFSGAQVFNAQHSI